MTEQKDLAEHQVTAHVVLEHIFQYMPENPQRFSNFVEQSLVSTALDKAIFAMQLITGLNQFSCSEIVHTTYESLTVEQIDQLQQSFESLNPSIKQEND
tara:strand:- start:214 stop:510 length:297 start_codon:yes stop_codon:yes gene_type:complete